VVAFLWGLHEVSVDFEPLKGDPMDLYGLLLFVHVASVIGWVGTGVVFQMLSERALPGGQADEGRVRSLLNLGESFGPAYFGVLTLLVLATGIWMVLDADWGFDEPFVLGGIIGIVASGAIGGALIGPTSQKLQARVAESGVITAEDTADIARIRSFGRIDMLIMLVVVFLMTVKPGT
jgi:Predicted integral membrane protein (DUF2269)